MSKIASYTAADVPIPVKILHDGRLMKTMVDDKFVLMRHLQLCPTNRCNLNCDFCSCGDRDKNQEMPLVDVINLLDIAKGCGCQAITITGGGEPLLHPDINDIIRACNERSIKVGLVTNGMVLENLDGLGVEWCRISFDSNRKFKPLAKVLNRILKKHLPIDWAFSYVAYSDKGMGELKRVVKYANHNGFTHVRVVGDILNPSDELVNKCKRLLQGMDKKVIYQPRTTPDKGRQNCWISLLKPTIAADGTIFPCCGAQYAIKSDKRDFHEAMGMGKDLKEVITKQQKFDGSVCDVCFYDNYNAFMQLIMNGLKHREWV